VEQVLILFLVLLPHLEVVVVDHIQQSQVWLVALVAVLVQIHLVVVLELQGKDLLVEIVPQLRIKMALVVAVLALLGQLI
jgi:hypothetical protein